MKQMEESSEVSKLREANSELEAAMKGYETRVQPEKMKSDDSESNMGRRRMKSWRWRMKSWRTTLMILRPINWPRKTQEQLGCWTTTNNKQLATPAEPSMFGERLCGGLDDWQY